MFEHTDWLTHSVPLWAFLLALLTSPTLWASKISERIGPLFDRYLPTGTGAGTRTDTDVDVDDVPEPESR